MSMPTDSPPKKPTGGVEREMIDWIRQQVRERAVVKIPELRQELLDNFLNREGFLQRYFKECLDRTLYDLVQRSIAYTRERMVVEGEVLTKAEFEERGRLVRSKWEVWMEHSGTRHIRLLEMRRSDLALAIQERKERGDHEHRLMALFSELDKGLPDETTTVGQVFVPEQIERTWRQLCVTTVVRKKDGEE